MQNHVQEIFSRIEALKKEAEARRNPDATGEDYDDMYFEFKPKAQEILDYAQKHNVPVVLDADDLTQMCLDAAFPDGQPEYAHESESSWYDETEESYYEDEEEEA